MNIVLFLFAALFVLVKCQEGHKCIHDLQEIPIEQENVPHVSVQEYKVHPYSRHAKRAGQRQNIRIYFDTTRLDTAEQIDSQYTCFAVGQQITTDQGTYTCQENDVLTPAKSAFIVNSLLEPARQRLESALLVTPVEGNLTLSAAPFNCYSSSTVRTTVPIDPYKTTGIPDTDLIYFVTGRKITTNGVLAFAGACMEDQFGRPIAGYINFNLASITSTIRDLSYNSKLGVAMHEMTHVLGFSYGRLDDFRDENGDRIPLNQTTLVTRVNDKRVIKVITPTVLSVVPLSSEIFNLKAREHFDCPFLDGVEIEDQGGNGTARSHWEKRILNNEYMIGTSSDQPVFSQFTLAFLQDSGWYTVNFTAASPMLWGWKEGCGFVLDKCKDWDGDNYLCITANQNSCNFNRLAKSTCYLQNLPNLPVEFQYFTDPTLAGSDTLADYCPYYDAYSNGYCIDVSLEGTSTLEIGEEYCDSCRCFDSTLLKSSPTANPVGQQGCYRTYCTNSTTLKVKIGDYWYDCPQGKEITAVNFGGKLTCPSTDILCVGAPEDNTWIEFKQISPNKGGPGSKFTVYGKNFVTGMQVIISDEFASNCTLVSSTEYECLLADSSHYTNPRHLFGVKSDVVLVDPASGRSIVARDAFEVKLAFNSTFFKAITNWIENNVIVTAAVLAVAVALCVVCCFCCRRQRKKYQKSFY